MKRPTLFFFLIVCLGMGLVQAQTTAPAESVDFQKARALLQKQQSGDALTAEEQAYLEHAKALRRQGQGKRPEQGGRPVPSNQRPAPERLIPLSDMGANDRYEGEDGGLYGGGTNTPPETLRKAAEALLAEIRPLDAEGNPSSDGAIVLVSISMSNATQEFSFFKQLADDSPAKSAKVTVVDCAQGGQAMAEWVPADGRPWQVALDRLKAAGVSPNQVQVAWVKLANKSPSGSLADHGRKLEEDTIEVLQNARVKFPNLKIAYLGSRIWAGNAKGGLNPEPYAYESAFAVRGLIDRQMEGDAELTPDRAPLLVWGPYLWAEGERGRKSDDLVWAPGDFASDGVHPSQSGREKVARLLLDFFSTDPLAKPWFKGN